MHRVTSHCDAQTELFEWTSLQPFHGGDVVTCFDVVGCRVRWSNVVGCEVTWGEVRWLVARCHVMWCDVVSCHLMWCDFLCCVMSRDAMWCHVMCSHMMSVICCEVMRCNGMRSHEFVMRCGWLRCHVVWFEVVVWCGELEDELVIRTTKHCKYYTVLQSTTPVLLQYYSVLLSTTQYYSALQSTTPVLLCTTKSKHYKVLLRLIVQHMKCPVQCAKQQESPSAFTKYCACHKKWFWWLILASHETTSKTVCRAAPQTPSCQCSRALACRGPAAPPQA